MKSRWQTKRISGERRIGEVEFIMWSDGKGIQNWAALSFPFTRLTTVTMWTSAMPFISARDDTREPRNHAGKR